MGVLPQTGFLRNHRTIELIMKYTIKISLLAAFLANVYVMGLRIAQLNLIDTQPTFTCKIPSHGTFVSKAACKRIGWVHTLVMSIKPICRHSSTWCHRGKSWSRHQNCKRMRLVQRCRLLFY